MYLLWHLQASQSIWNTCNSLLGISGGGESNEFTYEQQEWVSKAWGVGQKGWIWAQTYQVISGHF